MSIIPFDDRDGYIWMDGEMLPWREAKLHVLSHGLHYASSCFEGERAYDGTIFKLREHSLRMAKSAEWLDFKLPISVEELDQVCKDVIAANNTPDGYVRPVTWRGADQLAVSAMDSKIHLAVASWTWPKYFFPKGGEGAGLALGTSRWRRPHPSTMPVQSKAAGVYTIGTVAKHEANRAGFDDAFMLDYQGRVAESTGSNIFFIKGKSIKTPVPECFLNGITRQTVIVLARELYTVEECTIMPDEIGNFDECFVTGTAAEVSSVGKIDDVVFQPFGPVMTHIQDRYSDLVRQKAKAAA